MKILYGNTFHVLFPFYEDIFDNDKGTSMYTAHNITQTFILDIKNGYEVRLVMTVGKKTWNCP